MHVRTPSGRTLHLGIVATDYDRTLTDVELEAVPAALAQLARLRSEGVKTVLCTGRTRPEIPPGPLLSFFDGVVLEGGGMLGPPSDIRPVVLPPEWMRKVEAWLQARSITYVSGESYLSALATKMGTIAELPKDVPASVNLNHDRVDITPPGVDKGSSLMHLAGTMGWKGDILAFGDGDNDAQLFAVAKHSVAVGNAVDALKARADDVGEGYGGFGVAKYLAGLVRAPGSRRPPPQGSHRTRRPLEGR